MFFGTVSALLSPTELILMQKKCVTERIACEALSLIDCDNEDALATCEHYNKVETTTLRLILNMPPIHIQSKDTALLPSTASCIISEQQVHLDRATSNGVEDVSDSGP